MLSKLQVAADPKTQTRRISLYVFGARSKSEGKWSSFGIGSTFGRNRHHARSTLVDIEFFPLSALDEHTGNPKLRNQKNWRENGALPRLIAVVKNFKYIRRDHLQMAREGKLPMWNGQILPATQRIPFGEANGFRLARCITQLMHPMCGAPTDAMSVDQWGLRERKYHWKHRVDRNLCWSTRKLNIHDWSKGFDLPAEPHDKKVFMAACGRDNDADAVNQEARECANELLKCVVELKVKCRKCPMPNHETKECNDSCPICGKAKEYCWGLMYCTSSYVPSISVRFACGNEKSPPVNDGTIIPYSLQSEIRSVRQQKETQRRSWANANVFDSYTTAHWLDMKQTALEREAHVILELADTASNPGTHSEPAILRAGNLWIGTHWRRVRAISAHTSLLSTTALDNEQLFAETHNQISRKPLSDAHTQSARTNPRTRNNNRTNLATHVA